MKKSYHSMLAAARPVNAGLNEPSLLSMRSPHRPPPLRDRIRIRQRGGIAASNAGHLWERSVTLSGHPLFGAPAALPVLTRGLCLDRTAARTPELADLLHP